MWTRIVEEDLGLKYVQFVADLLNVFLPPDIVVYQVERINECVQKRGLAITSTFTSAFTRVNHFMHPDADIRKARFASWRKWLRAYSVKHISDSVAANHKKPPFGKRDAFRRAVFARGETFIN